MDRGDGGDPAEEGVVSTAFRQTAYPIGSESRMAEKKTSKGEKAYMQSTRKRVTALLLSFVMALSLLPAMTGTASAADTDNAASWPSNVTSKAVSPETFKAKYDCSDAVANLYAAQYLAECLQDSEVKYIQLVADVKCTGDDFAELVQFTVSGEKHLDLNGYTIEIWQNQYRHKFNEKKDSLFDIPGGASLTVYDTSAKGTGRINYNSKLDQKDFKWPERNIFCVENGGTLTVNGGTIESGRTIKRWVNDTFDYVGYARQYVAGSPVVALGGSTVTINGGKFISRKIAAWGTSYNGTISLGSKYSGVDENRSVLSTVTINDGEFLADGGDSCILCSGEPNVKIVIRGGRFVCDKNDRMTYSGNETLIGEYGRIAYDTALGKNVDVTTLIDPDSEITKYLDKGDVEVDKLYYRPELVVQPKTGTSDELVKIKDPGFTAWKPGSKVTRTVQLDTDYPPLYYGLYQSQSGPGYDYNENTTYSVKAVWNFVGDEGAVISNSITTSAWDQPVDLSRFTSRGVAFNSAWSATGYKVLTCTVTEKYKSRQHEYTSVNTANWLIYFSYADYSGTAVTLTAAPGDAQNSATTPVAVTAQISDSLGSNWYSFLFNKRMQFGYIGSDNIPVVTNVVSVGENQNTVSCTLTDLPEGEVTLWAQYSGTWNGDELTFSTTQKVFVLPKITYSSSDVYFSSDDDGYIKYTSDTKPTVYLQAIDPAKVPGGCKVTWEIWNGGTGKWVTLSDTNAAYPDLTIDSHGHLRLADARSGLFRSSVTYGGKTWYSPITMQVVGTDKTTGQKITAAADTNIIFYEDDSRSACNVTYTRDTEADWGTWWKVYVLVTQGNVPEAAWENLKNSPVSYQAYGDGYLVEASVYQSTVKNDDAVTSVTADIGQKLKSYILKPSNTVAEGYYKLTPVAKIWTGSTSAEPTYMIAGSPFTFYVGTKASGISLKVDGKEVVSADGFTKSTVTGGYKYTKANGEYTMTNKQTVQLAVNANGVYPRRNTDKTYVSSDSNILAVDNKGKVTALKPGTAYVTVTYTGYDDYTSPDATASKYTYVTSVKITVPIAELKMSEPVWANYIGKYYKDIKLNISHVRSYNGEWVSNSGDKYATSKASSMTTYATGQNMWSQFSTLKVAYNDSYTVQFEVKAKDGYQFPLSDLKEYDSSGNPVYYSSKGWYCVDDMSLKTNKLGSEAMDKARANGYTTLTSNDYCYTGETGITKSDPAFGVTCSIPCIKDPSATYIKTVAVTTATPKEGDLRCAVMPSDDVIGTANYNQVNMLGAQVTTLMTVKNASDGGVLLGVSGSASKLTTIAGSGTPYEPVATGEKSANGGYFGEYYTTLGDSYWKIDKTKLQTARYEAATYVNQLNIWSAVTSEDGNKYYFDPEVELYVNGYKVQLITDDGQTSGWSTRYLSTAYYYVADPSPAFIEGTVSGVTAPVSGVAPDYDSMTVGGTRTDKSVSDDALYVSKCVWFIDANDDGIADEDEIAKPIMTQVETNDEDGNPVTEAQITGYQNLDANGGFLGGKVYSMYIELAVEENMGRIDNQSFHLKMKVGSDTVNLNTAGSSGTYTFPETEIVGYEVSGQVTSYNPGNSSLQVKLSDGTENYTAALTKISDGSGQITQRFTFAVVKPGVYDLVITKDAHLTYTIKGVRVTSSDLDLTMHTNDAISAIKMIVGDVNGDGTVDVADLNMLWNAANYGKAVTDANKLMDVNNDGTIDVADLNIVWNAANYGKGASTCTVSYN